MSSAKDNIRQFAKRHRDQLDISPNCAERAATIFLDQIDLTHNPVISVYFPIGSEMDTWPLVEKLWNKDIKLCLPIIQGKAIPLLFAEWTGTTTLKKSNFGTQEPADSRYCIPDIVIVPLLAFDQQGNRIGYGQGHYDATLHHLRAEKECLAVGMAHSGQAVLLALPTESHDEKLDLVVTEQRIFDFRR